MAAGRRQGDETHGGAFPAAAGSARALTDRESQALFRRDAGRADQLAPGLDLATEESGRLRALSATALVSQDAPALLDIRRGDDLVHRRIEPALDLVARFCRR